MGAMFGFGIWGCLSVIIFKITTDKATFWSHTGYCIGIWTAFVVWICTHCKKRRIYEELTVSDDEVNAPRLESEPCGSNWKVVWISLLFVCLVSIFFAWQPWREQVPIYVDSLTDPLRGDFDVSFYLNCPKVDGVFNY